MATKMQRQAGDGLFAWYDIMTVDEAATHPFYSALFGWDFNAEPRPNDGYRMVTFEGQGLGGSLPFATDSGRSVWMGYIQVSDIENQVARARELGSTIHVESMEIPHAGTFAVLDDPTGASFYLFEIVPEYRALATGYDRGSGHIIWNELITNDLTAAAAFYREIAGWELVPMSDDPHPYTIAKVDGAPVAGLFQPQNLPEVSSWIISVNTANVDATLEQAIELGGKVIHAANTVPGVGRTAWIADPTGGVVGLMQPAPGWLDRL